MESRFELEEFCMNFLCGREMYLRRFVEDYMQEYSEMGITLNSEALDPAFRLICHYVFWQKPVKC